MVSNELFYCTIYKHTTRIIFIIINFVNRFYSHFIFIFFETKKATTAGLQRSSIISVADPVCESPTGTKLKSPLVITVVKPGTFEPVPSVLASLGKCLCMCVCVCVCARVCVWYVAFESITS